MASPVAHPYLPKEISLPNYIPNDKGPVEILSIFFAPIACVLGFTWVVAGRHLHTTGPKLSASWFMVCGCIHTFFEGYFVLHHDSINELQDFPAQAWKEYSKGDSRYVISDNTILCIEGFTAFVVGPLCFLTVWLLLKKHPYRYCFQLLISTGQLYGTIIFFMMEHKENYIHSPMWHPLYFWFYFIFMNTIWIVVPCCLICHAFLQLSKTQEVVGNKQKNS